MLATNLIARCRLLLCLALICGWPTLVLGGVPVLPQPRQLTVADGLPSNVVYGFDEDENGYLWLASSDGLARYDGRNYRIWRIEEGLRDNGLGCPRRQAQPRLDRYRHGRSGHAGCLA